MPQSQRMMVRLRKLFDDDYHAILGSTGDLDSRSNASTESRGGLADAIGIGLLIGLGSGNSRSGDANIGFSGPMHIANRHGHLIHDAKLQQPALVVLQSIPWRFHLDHSITSL